MSALDEVAEDINELREMMRQIKSDEYGVEDYGFIDSLVHGNSSNSSGLVSNVGVHIAVYGDSEGVRIDDELLEELDRRLTERAKVDSSNPERVQMRTKHRDMVYGEGSRDGEGLLDRDMSLPVYEQGDEGPVKVGNKSHETGHQFIESMIEDFLEASGLDEQEIREPEQNDAHVQTPARIDGGEIMTEPDDVKDSSDDREAAVTRLYGVLEELAENHQEIQQVVDENYDGEMNEFASDVYGALESEIEESATNYDNVADFVESLDYEGLLNVLEDSADDLEEVRDVLDYLERSRERTRGVREDFEEDYL